MNMKQIHDPMSFLQRIFLTPLSRILDKLKKLNNFSTRLVHDQPTRLKWRHIVDNVRQQWKIVTEA